MHATDELNTRLCPDCRSPLKPESFQGIELDICEICAGIWLDMGELRRLMRAGPLTLLQAEDRVKPKANSERNARSRARSLRLCPRCRQALHPYRYMHSSFIVLDGCEHCSGIWADEGELQQIEEWLVNREQRAASRPEHLLAVAHYEREHERQVEGKQIIAHIMKWLKMRARLR